MREKEDALEEKLNKFDKALVRELRELLDAYTDLFTIEQEEDFSNGKMELITLLVLDVNCIALLYK